MTISTTRMPLYNLWSRWPDADINQQAEQMFHRLIEEMAQKQGVTEQLKAKQPMEWIGLMNNIQACAREIVNNEIIFS